MKEFNAKIKYTKNTDLKMQNKPKQMLLNGLISSQQIYKKNDQQQ